MKSNSLVRICGVVVLAFGGGAMMTPAWSPGYELPEGVIGVALERTPVDGGEWIHYALFEAPEEHDAPVRRHAEPPEITAESVMLDECTCSGCWQWDPGPEPCCDPPVITGCSGCQCAGPGGSDGCAEASNACCTTCINSLPLC